MLYRLDENSFVAGQISPDDMATLKAAGIAAIVNNRPDGEEPGQPPASEIEAAARAAGLDYRFVPIAGGISGTQIDAMAEALEQAKGPVLAFCRIGMRSTYAWALARARLGDDPGEIEAKAAKAGFDLAPITAFLHKQ